MTDRITFSLPDDLAAEVEDAADRFGVNRSALVRLSLRHTLDQEHAPVDSTDHITFACPDDLADQIDAEADSRGVTTDELLIQAARDAVGPSPDE